MRLARKTLPLIDMTEVDMAKQFASAQVEAPPCAPLRSDWRTWRYPSRFLPRNQCSLLYGVSITLQFVTTRLTTAHANVETAAGTPAAGKFKPPYLWHEHVVAHAYDCDLVKSLKLVYRRPHAGTIVEALFPVLIKANTPAQSIFSALCHIWPCAVPHALKRISLEAGYRKTSYINCQPVICILRPCRRKSRQKMAEGYGHALQLPPVRLKKSHRDYKSLCK